MKAQKKPVSVAELQFSSAFESDVFKGLPENKDMMALLFATNLLANRESVQVFRDDFNKVIATFKKRQAAYQDEERFLSYVFYKIHRKFLKNYEQQLSFMDLAESGKYDCVSGTAFYAMILDTLGYSFRIKELEYHTYLLVQPIRQTNKQYIFESTDAEAGFISDPELVAQLTSFYEEENSSALAANESEKDTYQFDFNIRHNISLYQLAGLAYYNSAINFYNKHNLAQAEAQLKKAMFIYNSKRMETFMSLIKQTAAYSGIPRSSIGK